MNFVSYVLECRHKFLSFCHDVRVCQTDEQTDGQKGLRNTVCCITCSCMEKNKNQTQKIRRLCLPLFIALKNSFRYV